MKIQHGWEKAYEAILLAKEWQIVNIGGTVIFSGDVTIDRFPRNQVHMSSTKLNRVLCLNKKQIYGFDKKMCWSRGLQSS